MIEEIIYTSAPKGLRSGSHGFCTVISTAGMAANMAERLESMSGYRHAFPLNDPNNSLNPVNYVHVTTRLAGEKRHIISRVADAGQDYSGRTNKLAHHIALEGVQNFTAGPARLLESGLLISSWDGKVETRAPRVVTNPDVPARILLSAWKAATGDGGWAGAVAEKLLATKAPVNVIFKAGMDTLPLVVEVMDLVPVPKRWEITFSTYFTRLLAGTECQLRFYLHGTSEATTIRNDARATVIDLAQPLPSAEGGPLVAKARSGVIEYSPPAVRKAAAGLATRSGARTVSNAELDQFLDEGDELAVAGDDGEWESPFELGATRNSKLAGTFRHNRRRMPIPVIASIAVILVAAIGTGAFVLSRPAKTNVPNGRINAATRFEPVAAMETNDREEKQTATPETQKQRPVEAEPDPIVENPFGSQRPFDRIRQMLADNSGPAVWQLPAAAANLSSQAWDVYVCSADSVSMSCDSQSITVVPTADDHGRKWQLTVDDVSLGYFQIECREEGVPALLSWTWSSEIAATQDLFGSTAVAIREFRSCRISLDATEISTPYSQPADALKITIAGDEWPRFSHLSNDDNNLQNSLGVPAPGIMNNNGDLNRTSDSLFLDAETVNAVSFGMLPECNALIEEHDAYLAKSIVSSKDSSIWNVGLMPKGGVPKDGEVFGQYKLKPTTTAGIVELSFEWLPNVDFARAAPLQWIPIEVSIAGQSHVIFPRGPEVVPPQELVDLGQGDECLCPATYKSELPLRFPNDSVEVNFEIRIRSKTTAIDGTLKATRQNPTPETELAFFELQSPIGLQAARLQSSSGLGFASLTATPVKSPSGIIPAAIELRTACSFNRSSIFHLDALRMVNVFDPAFWNDKNQFREQQFVDTSNLLLNQTAGFSGPLAAEFRNPESRLARYAKQKDAFKRIERHLKDSIAELDRLLTFSDLDLRPAYPRVFPAALEKRNAPKVKELLQRQRDELEKVRVIYSEDQWKADTATIGSLQEGLSQLVAEIKISLQLQRENGNPIRIYFVSTAARGKQ